MSKALYDFLADSELFKDANINNGFKKFTDKELVHLLAEYREHCKSSQESIQQELNSANGSLRVFSEQSRPGANAPSDAFLKQTAFYFESFVITDPLFPHATPRSEIQGGFDKLLGMNSDPISRTSVADACRFMKHVTPLVAGGYLKFIPIKERRDHSAGIPIRYSETLFADLLPPEVLDWLRERAVVKTMLRADKSWLILKEDNPDPSRGIHISFGDKDLGFIYFLSDVEFGEIDKKTGKASFVQTFPDTPPTKEQFDIWVRQSINQSANSEVQKILTGVSIASTLQSHYLTTSAFEGEFLGKNIPLKNSVQTETANSLLQLQLPLTDQISFFDLMRIRENDGEAFSRFRTHLEQKMFSLRGIENPELLKKKIEEVTHELLDVEVRDIELAFKAARKKLFADAVITLGTLGLAIQGHPLTPYAIAVASGGGYKSYQDFRANVKLRPSYFLWKAGRS